jgi:hypothetical protein
MSKKTEKKFRKMIIERAGYLATAIRVHQNIENVSIVEFPLVKMCQKYGHVGTYNLYAWSSSEKMCLIGEIGHEVFRYLDETVSYGKSCCNEWTLVFFSFWKKDIYSVCFKYQFKSLSVVQFLNLRKIVTLNIKVEQVQK